MGEEGGAGGGLTCVNCVRSWNVLGLDVTVLGVAFFGTGKGGMT